MLYIMMMTFYLSAVKKIKEKHYDIEEVYTPFPVHGLDKVWV